MAEPLDADALDRLAALESKAMRRPWFADARKPHSEDGWLVFGGDGDGLVTCHGNMAYSATEGVGSPDQDAQFIVALRNAAPALLRLARAGLAAEQRSAALATALADVGEEVDRFCNDPGVRRDVAKILDRVALAQPEPKRARDAS